MLTDRPPFDWAQVADREEAARLLSFARPLTLSPKSCLWHAGDSPDLLVRVEQGLLRAKLVLEDGSSYAITSMFMGVPHTMVFVDSLGDELVSSVGRRIEKNPVFPQGTNVNFVVIHGRSKIEVRTWERGAGATLACGTGCCASAVAACLNGYTDRNVTVQVQLGSLQIQYAADETVWMSGPAEIVYRGVWDTI